MGRPAQGDYNAVRMGMWCGTDGLRDAQAFHRLRPEAASIEVPYGAKGIGYRLPVTVSLPGSAGVVMS